MLLLEAKNIANEILNEGFYAVHSSPNLFKQLSPKGQDRALNAGVNTYGNGIYFVPGINPYGDNSTTGYGKYTYICYIKGSLKDDFIEAGTTTLKDIFGHEIKNLHELEQLDLYTPKIEKALNGCYAIYHGKYGKRNSSIYKDKFKEEEKLISAKMKKFDDAVKAFYNNGTLIKNHRFLYMFSEMIKDLFFISPSKLASSINGAIKSVFFDLTMRNRERIINNYDYKINPETIRLIDDRSDTIGKKYAEKVNNELNDHYSNFLKALDEMYEYGFLSDSEKNEKYDNIPQTFFDNLMIKARVHNMNELTELIKRIAIYHEKIRQSARAEAVFAMISLLPVTMIYMSDLYHNRYIRRLKKGIYVPRRIDMWKGWKELIVWDSKDIKVVKRTGPKASFDNLRTHRLDKEDSERFKPTETGWSGSYNFS